MRMRLKAEFKRWQRLPSLAEKDCRRAISPESARGRRDRGTAGERAAACGRPSGREGTLDLPASVQRSSLAHPTGEGRREGNRD